MDLSNQIKYLLKQALIKAYGIEDTQIEVEHPSDVEHGDYASNIALKVASNVGESSRLVAENIVKQIESSEAIEKVVIAGPGFINIFISTNLLLQFAVEANADIGKNKSLEGKKIMVEYAHPNTHKEMHIGHMRTLIVGESLARILSYCGAEVYRANYQGDIGPHVAKAIWGTLELLDREGITFDEAQHWSNTKKAHLLGQGYVLANTEFEAHAEEIRELNSKLYKHDKGIMEIYQTTRQWSLDYYGDLYTRFGTKFDKLYFESNMVSDALEVVNKHVGSIFQKSDGAIIYEGEKHGLHTRVFVTADGYPTYEGKDMALAPKQFADFPFDLAIHVVGDEQAGYFKVVIKAMEELYPYLEGREYHLPMGMVNLKGLKMSSRTGVLITVDGLLEEVKDLVKVQSDFDDSVKDKEDVLESITIGAVKYSVLKNDPTSYVLFDLQESINLSGNSGPYLQYTYARCNSILAKSVDNINDSFTLQDECTLEELALIRTIYQFSEQVELAAKQYAPNMIATFLFNLAQTYNSMYQKSPILHEEVEEKRILRLILTKATSDVLKRGLNLLGINSPERM